MTSPAGGRSLGRALIEVRADLSGFPKDLRDKLKAAFSEATKGVEFSEIGDAAERAGTEAADRAGKAMETRGKVTMRRAGQRNGDSFIGGLLDAVTKTLASRAVLIGGLVAGAIAAGFAALPAATALAGTFPALLTGLVGSVFALTLSFSGLGDAMKAAFSNDPAKLAEAMKELAPAARAFVLEIKALEPVVERFQQTVQQSFFEQFGRSVTDLTTKLLPALQVGLADLSATFGSAGRVITNVLIDPANASALGKSLQDVSAGIGAVLNETPGLVQAFIQLASVGAPFAQVVLGSMATALGQFNETVAQAAADGSLAEMFEAGFTVLSAIGGVLADLGGIIVSVFKAVSADGEGLFTVFEQITGAINEFFASAQGQAALSGLLDIMGLLGDVITGVLGPLLPVLGQLVQILGTALSGALKAVMPGIVSLAQSLAGALLPVMPKLNELFQSLIPLFALVGEVIGELGAALAPIVTEVLLSVGQVLIETITSLTPVLIDLIPPLLEIVKAILPILPPLFQALAATAQVGIPILGALLQVVVAILDPLLRLVAILIQAIVAFVDFAILDQFTKNVEKAIGPVTDFTDEISNMVGDLSRFTSSLDADAVVEFFEDIGGVIADFFTNTLPAFLSRLQSFGKALPGMIFDGMVEQMGRMVGLVLAAILKLPDLIIAAVQQVGPALMSLSQEIFDLVLSMFDRSTTTLGDLIRDRIERIMGFIGSLPGRILAIGPMLFNAAVSLGRRIGDGLAQIGSFASDIGRRIVNAVKSGINRIISSINSGIADIDNFIPGPSLPRLPQFERGGIIDEPTLGILGEKGKREVVLPLTDPDRANELARQAGLFGILKQPTAQPAVYVTAVLGTGEILTVIDQRVELGQQRQGDELAHGPRSF
jgi:phage-related protein